MSLYSILLEDWALLLLSASVGAIGGFGLWHIITYFPGRRRRLAGNHCGDKRLAGLGRYHRRYLSSQFHLPRKVFEALLEDKGFRRISDAEMRHYCGEVLLLHCYYWGLVIAILLLAVWFFTSPLVPLGFPPVRRYPHGLAVWYGGCMAPVVIVLLVRVGSLWCFGTLENKRAQTRSQAVLLQQLWQQLQHPHLN